MTPPAIDRRTLDIQAADLLRTRILSGELAPGSVLTELALAQDCGLSRGTIRAALQRLAFEGLVVQTPYTGWEVQTLTAQDAWELYTLRGALEGLAASLAAASPPVRPRGQRLRRPSQEEGDWPLLSCYSRLEAACGDGDAGAIAEADYQLHKCIIELSGNRRLATQYLYVEQQIRAFIASSNALVVGTQGVLEQHRPIVEAIRDGNPVEAERLARDHNVGEGEILVRHLSRLAEASRPPRPPPPSR